jgi:hypothetical protein
MTNYTPDTIQPGEPWACKFKVRCWLTAEGIPANVIEQQLETQPSEYTVGEWTSWGIIMRRDEPNQLLEIEDQQCENVWVVAYTDVWDVDRAELTNDNITHKTT